jgi:carbonic anhydrase/acetyltransferase-like protein (isoleucine patch superfamily)
VVRAGALVGAGAVVSDRVEVPARAMALGIPAKMRLDAVPEGVVQLGADMYVENVARYKAELVRLD